MSKIGLQKTEIHFICKNRMKMSAAEMSRQIGRSPSCVQKYLRDNNLTPPKILIRRWQGEATAGRTTFTPAQDKIIKRLYMKMPSKALALKIGKSDTGLRTRLRQLGLSIPRDIIEQNRQSGRFKPGSISHNKGKKMSEALYKKCKATMFKKGNLPASTLYDGAIVIRHVHQDRNEKPYKWIRLSLGVWMSYQRYIWQQHHGKIPAGTKIIFRDGNTLNCDISNLQAVTTAQLMKLNSFHNYPEPIAKAVQLRGALNRQINKHLKKFKK